MTDSATLESHMKVFHDTKKHLSYSPALGWFWCDRDECDNPEAQHGPFNSFADAVSDAVEPYVNDSQE